MLNDLIARLIREFNDYVFMCIYSVIVCWCARRIAENDSFIGVRVPAPVRAFLLILSFQRERISILCIISQVYGYIMIILFIVSRFHPLYFLDMLSSDPNALYRKLLIVHVFLLIPFAIIETEICDYLRRKKHSL